MRTIEIKKDKLGYWKYQLAPGWGFNYFPDYVKTRADMEQYFKQGGGYGIQGGRYDAPILKIVDETGKPINNYLVTRNGNHISVNVNNDETLTFHEETFCNIPEQLEFLRNNSDRKIENEAESLTNDRDKYSFYKSHADKEILNGLQELIKSKMSDIEIRSFLKEHSMKFYNVPANVEFLK